MKLLNKNLNIPLGKVLPRTDLNPNDEEKVTRNFLKFNPSALQEPIFVMFARDLDKYIIIDGHNRFSAHKDLKKKKIFCIIKGTQYKTTFDLYKFPKIQWSKYGNKHR